MRCRCAHGKAIVNAVVGLFQAPRFQPPNYTPNWFGTVYNAVATDPGVEVTVVRASSGIVAHNMAIPSIVLMPQANVRRRSSPKVRTPTGLTPHW